MTNIFFILYSDIRIYYYNYATLMPKINIAVSIKLILKHISLPLSDTLVCWYIQKLWATTRRNRKTSRFIPFNNFIFTSLPFISWQLQRKPNGGDI